MNTNRTTIIPQKTNIRTETADVRIDTTGRNLQTRNLSEAKIKKTETTTTTKRKTTTKSNPTKIQISLTVETRKIKTGIGKATINKTPEDKTITTTTAPLQATNLQTTTKTSEEGGNHLGEKGTKSTGTNRTTNTIDIWICRRPQQNTITQCPMRTLHNSNLVLQYAAPSYRTSQFMHNNSTTTKPSMFVRTEPQVLSHQEILNQQKYKKQQTIYA